MDDLQKEILKAARSAQLLEFIARRVLVESSERNELADALATAHNSGTIDIVSVFQTLKNGSGPNFFMLRHVFEKLLPSLEADVSQVIHCVDHLYKEAGRDLAAGFIINSYVSFCEADQRRPQIALSLVLGAPNQTQLLGPTLIAGAHVDRPSFLPQILQLIQNGTQDQKIQAVFALGKANWPDGSLQLSEIYRLLEQIIFTHDDLLIAPTIRTILTLSKFDKSKEATVFKLINHALANGGELSLHVCSEFLSFSESDIDGALFESLMSKLKGVRPSNKGTIDNIDILLAKLVKTDKVHHAVGFLESVLLSNAGEIAIGDFDSALHAIANDRILKSKLLTRWLLNGSPILCRDVEKFFDHPEHEQYPFDVDTKELGDAEPDALIFLARKAVGYLFFKPTSVASILLGAMKATADTQVLAAIGNLMFESVLLHFPGRTREYIVERLSGESETTRGAAQAALNSLDLYLNDLQSIGDIPELYPSVAQREVHRRSFTRKMSRSLREAEKKSVLFELATKSVLLYGRKSINYIYGSEGPPRRVEFSLSPHQFEMDVPRGEQIDPFGLDYMLRVFRYERRKQ